jgi:hypothetical protein
LRVIRRKEEKSQSKNKKQLLMKESDELILPRKTVLEEQKNKSVNIEDSNYQAL